MNINISTYFKLFEFSEFLLLFLENLFKNRLYNYNIFFLKKSN